VALVRLLPPTFEAVEITEANLPEVRSKLTPLNRAADDPVTVAGEPIAVGDWAVAVENPESTTEYIVYPPNHIEVVEP